MKKFFLSLFVITSFIIYAIVQRNENRLDYNYNSDKTAISSSSPPDLAQAQKLPLSSATATPSPSVPVSLPTPTPRKNTPFVIINQPTPTAAPPAPSATPPIPSVTPTPTPTPTPSGLYRDGTYTGSAADAYYGNVQVQAIVQGGKIVDIQFLDYPQDRSNSIRINTRAMPLLRSEAIQAQSAQVDIVSGATDTSYAFISSLGSALDRARI